MKIDGIATNGQLDSSGEILNVAGHDITDLLEGKGVLNWEHEKGAEDILGAVTYAKKIMEEKDCENDRQKMYWELSGKVPFVYIIGELYDLEEHPGAVAAAALIRYYSKRNEKLLVGFSIEGQTLERDGNKLERSVGRRVAMTLRPCNKSCIAGLLEDPKSKAIVEKSEGSRDDQYMYTIDSVILEDAFNSADPWLELKKSIDDLNKTLTAGGGGCAPSQLTGGAALVVEDKGLRNRMKAALRDWDRARPLKETIKAALPEVSDEYLNHFVNLATDLSLKKGLPVPKLFRIGTEHSPNQHSGDEQKKLIEGIYLDPSQMFDPGHTDYTSPSIWRGRNDAGEQVIMKPHVDMGFSTHSPVGAHNSTHYFQLASKVFGMGKHVPPTNYFLKPHDQAGEKPMQVMRLLEGAKPLLMLGNDTVSKLIQRSREDGTLHKLFLMDHILGASGDRHEGNVMVGGDGTVYHIDNDRAFNHPRHAHSAYINTWQEAPYNISKDQIHIDAKRWLDAINPKIMATLMSQYGVHPQAVKQAVQTLLGAKLAVSRGATMQEIADGMHEGSIQQ